MPDVKANGALGAPFTAMAASVGASLTAVTAIVPVPVLLEHAVLPPGFVTAAVPPAVPLVWSHAT